MLKGYSWNGAFLSNFKVNRQVLGFTPVILATQEAEIKRIAVQSQPGQTVRETLSLKNITEKRASGVVQGVGPEFKPQRCKNKTKQKYQHFLISS
jgi:hypothetical protein